MKQMMKKTLLALGATAALSTSAMAANTGVGVGVANNTGTIRGDFMIQDGIRLEPYLSFSYMNVDEAYVNTSGSNIALGTSAHLVKDISPTINVYYGGFVGITSIGIYGDYTTFDLGPVAGVEYSLDPQFTLGAEVRFKMSFGDRTTMETASAVVLRYYFD